MTKRCSSAAGRVSGISFDPAEVAAMLATLNASCVVSVRQWSLVAGTLSTWSTSAYQLVGSTMYLRSTKDRGIGSTVYRRC